MGTVFRGFKSQIELDHITIILRVHKICTRNYILQASSYTKYDLRLFLIKNHLTF